MLSTIEQLNPTRVKLTIELPFSELQPALEKAYQEIASHVNLPGFRKGKVPNSLIDQRFGRGAVLQEAINDSLPNAYAEAAREHNLIPLGQPEVEVTKLEDGKLVEFTAEVDVRPDFDLADPASVSIEVKAVEVTDEEVNERVDLLRERFATFTELDRAAEDGDFVVINLKAFQNGEELKDTDAHDMSYRLGTGGMIEGLDEALLGMTAGETKTFTTKLVGGTRKDEEAEIEVSLTKVQNQELPELNDEFAQLVSEFDHVDDMLADIRDNLVRIGRIDQANLARDLVLQKMVELTSFELPTQLVTDEATARKTQIEQQLAQAGLSIERYLAETKEAADEETFWADIEARSTEALRAQVLLDKFADDNEIGVTQHDLSDLVMQKAMQHGSTPDQEVQHMMEHNHAGEWMGEIRRGKALGSLVNAATITDTNGVKVDLSRLQSDGTLADEETEVERSDDSAASQTKDGE